MAVLTTTETRGSRESFFAQGAVLAVFFLSGAAGLIYEVIWTRALLTVFGATLYAVSTVLAAFMGGLALGSLVGGRLADRVARPLLLYAALEVLAGLTAIAAPWLLRLFDPLYHAVYARSAGETSFFALSLMRFGLSFVVLLIPTTCMGATLPVLSRFLVRRAGVAGSRIGSLYAVNTLGAVAGTFLAGFVLIAMLGVTRTIFVAAGASMLSGIGAALLSLGFEGRGKAPAPESMPVASEPGADISPGIARLVLVSYGVSGFVALAYQVFWTRALVFRLEFLKNTTYSFSAMLTVFLIGLAAGSAFMSSMIGRERRPVRLYGLLQILIGLSGAFSLFMLIHYVPFLRLGNAFDSQTQQFLWLPAVGNVFLRTLATLGLPTFLMGMAFPVAARICVRHLRQVGAGTGRLYAVNTLGAILGSFAAGFLLIPLFGLTRGLLVLGGVNVLIGATVLLADRSESGGSRRLVAVAAALAALVAFFWRMPAGYSFQELETARSQVVDYREGPLATVAVVENSIGDRTLYVDNVGVAGTDRVLLTDQKSLAHLPMLVLENPKSALTVGFGSGGASYSYTLYPELERIDCIEICDTVLQSAPFLKASNHGVLDDPRDPRFRIIIDDARSYLRFTDARYDIIATDCTDLRYKSNANLYDVEYFELCRDHITEKGAVVVWMPLAGMTERVFLCALKTFARVFPDMTIWYMNNEPTHYILLLGTHGANPLRIDLTRFLDRISRDAVQRDLGEISLQQAEKILSCFIVASGDLAPQYAGVPLNTEDFPYLEFESPKFGYGDEPLLTNLEVLRRAGRPDVARYIADADRHPDFMKRLADFERAVPHILDGHAFLRRLQLHEACDAYLEAKRICPEDVSVDFLLRFDDMRRAAETGNNPMSSTILGELEMRQKHYDGALRDFSAAMTAFSRRPPTPENVAFHRRAVAGMAQCYLDMGRAEAGLRFLRDYETVLRAAGKYDRLHEAMRAAAGASR